MLHLSQKCKFFCCLASQDTDGDFASTVALAEQAASGADSISCREIAQPLKVIFVLSWTAVGLHEHALWDGAPVDHAPV